MSAIKLPVRVPDADIRDGLYLGNLDLVGFMMSNTVHLKRRSGDPLELNAACGQNGGYRYGWGTVEYFGDRRPAICVKCRKVIEAAS